MGGTQLSSSAAARHLSCVRVCLGLLTAAPPLTRRPGPLTPWRCPPAPKVRRNRSLRRGLRLGAQHVLHELLRHPASAAGASTSQPATRPPASTAHRTRHATLPLPMPLTPTQRASHTRGAGA